ncbi:MAG: hypothetical protein IPF54_18235 [Draconibacterium sp.]|nr:hypothetical protein [Draconibacterium sp.]
MAITAITLVLLPFLNVKWKGMVVFAGIVLNTVVSTSVVIPALSGQFLSCYSPEVW